MGPRHKFSTLIASAGSESSVKTAHRLARAFAAGIRK